MTWPTKNMEQNVQEIKKTNNKLSESFHKEQLFLLVENVKMKRQLVHLFITISSGIIGGLLVFKESILIKNFQFIYFGVFLLLCNILYGFYYLVGFLSAEFRYLDKFHNTFLYTLKEVEKAQIDHHGNPTKENLKQLKIKQGDRFINISLVDAEYDKKVKKFNHGLCFLFIFFFFGLISLLLSTISFEFVNSIINLN